MNEKLKKALDEANEKEYGHIIMFGLLYFARIAVYIASFFKTIQYRIIIMEPIFWLLDLFIFLSYSPYKNEELPNVWHILSMSFFWNVIANVLAICVTLRMFDRLEGVFIQIPIHFALICSLDLISAYVLRLASNEFKKKKEI